MENLNIVLYVFAACSFVTGFLSMWTFFCTIDNNAQRAITHRDNQGWPWIGAGLLLAVMALSYASGTLTAHIDAQSLSGLFTIVFGTLSGVFFGIGTAIAANNDFTDKIFDQKYAWAYLIPIFVISIAGMILLS